MENNSLYHYTTLEGFHCIVNNGTPDKLRFHATHIRYLNDMSEYVYYQNLLWKSLKRHRKIVSEEAFNKFISSCDLFSDPYILSLSKNDDSLPMWHMYGNEATGVVLEFDKEIIENSLLRYNPQNDNVRLGECKYKETIEETVLNSYITAITKMNEHDKNIFDIIRLYSLDIKDNMVLHKSPDYKYEKEWRIYSRSRIIHTKVSKGQIKPYVEITLPISCLKSIKIGPCMPNKEQELQAIQFLLSTKVENADILNQGNMSDKVKITYSKITSYRNNM